MYEPQEAINFSQMVFEEDSIEKKSFDPGYGECQTQIFTEPSLSLS